MTSTTTASTAPVRRRINQEEIARFGEDAKRPVILLKIPQNIAAIWKPLFARGGMEGAHGLEPMVNLGHFFSDSGKFEDGAVLTVKDPKTDRESSYKCKLGPVTGAKSRIISAEVSERAENVKFEGVTTVVGQLMPFAMDESYKNLVKQRISAAEAKKSVQIMGQKEEREFLKKSGNLVISSSHTKPSAADNEDGEEAASNSTKKRKKEQPETGDDDDTETGGGTAGASGKKQKVKKGNKRELTQEQIREEVRKCFRQEKNWKRKDLRISTGLQFHKLSPILDELCEYDNTNKVYYLKPGQQL